MYGAPDLFVIENVARGFTDTVVHAEGELADVPCPFIDVEHAQKIVLAVTRVGLDDTTIFKTQADVVNCPSLVAAGQAETNTTPGAVFDWTGIDLAVRKIDMPITRQEGTAFYRKRKVGIFS